MPFYKGLYYVCDIVPVAEDKPSNKTNIILSTKENNSPVGNYDHHLGFHVPDDIRGSGHVACI